MDDELPPGFTITDYGPEAPAARYHRPTAARSPSPLTWLRIGGWLVAAGLALGSAWARVMQLSMLTPADEAYYFRLSYDGWGRPTLVTSDSLDLDSMTSGPNFGVLLCVAAAGLAVAAGSEWLPHRFRRQPGGRILAGLAAAFLLAVVLCEVVTNLPYRHSFGTPSPTLRFGLAPWLGGAGCLVAALGCLLARPAGDPAAGPAGAAGSGEILAAGEPALPME